MDRELLLLGVLRQQGMHGYQVHEFIDQYLASCTDLKKPTAYFLLDKLAKAGWITAEQVQEGHRPPRRVYRLTEQGEAAYQRLLRENLAAYVPAYFISDIGVAFLDDVPGDEARARLAQRRAALAAELETAQAAPVHPGSLQWLVEHRARHLQAELDWLDEILKRLAGRAA
ncbi:MAG: helix-turn-helix transcriptional regulator [Anaerolineales bacterium]|nr:helix-turn-helix transcriptional regulator [Anaerolineales bacterium]